MGRDRYPSSEEGGFRGERRVHASRVPGRSVRLARTSDGRRWEVSCRVSAPRGRVWQLLLDTERWPEWGPSVREVESPNRYVEARTRGRMRTPVGWVPFQVTTCSDYRWTWEVAGVPATGHRVDATSHDCVAVFEIPVWAAGYAPVCRRALMKIQALARDTDAGER